MNVRKNRYENVEFVINSKVLKKVDLQPNVKPNSSVKVKLNILKIKKEIDERKPIVPCSAINALKRKCKEYPNRVYEKRSCSMKKKAGRKPPFALGING